MKVADLLDILKITKQSLGRVLKQLIDQGYVVQKEGAQRPPPAPALRHRRRAKRWRMKLAGCRPSASRARLRELGPGAHEAARRFLVAMIDAGRPRRRAAA